MSTPTKGQTRNNGRAPKIRLSCDACAAAKVRCSKEQPECERCATNGSTCVYGPSRRSGKPPRDPNRHSTNRSTAAATTTSSSSEATKANSIAPSEGVQQEKAATDSTYDSSGFDTAPDWTNDLTDSLLQLGDAPIPPGADAFSTGFPFPPMDDSVFGSDALKQPSTNTTSSAEPWQLDARGTYPGSSSSSSLMLPPFDFQDLGASLGAEGSGGSSTSNSSAGSSGDKSLLNLPQPTRQQPLPPTPGSCDGRGCYALANSTLTALHSKRPLSQGSSPPPGSSPTSRSQSQTAAPSLDTILDNNKTAIQNVLQLLSCPCAADAHMALLDASITSKILIGYQVAAGITISSSSPTAVAEHAGASEAQGMASIESNSVSSASSYTMSSSSSNNGDYQGQARQFLLLGEIGKAGVLIDALSRMHEGNGAGCINNSMVTPTEPARNLYATLSTWLKAELTRITNKVKNSIADANWDYKGQRGRQPSVNPRRNQSSRPQCRTYRTSSPKTWRELTR